MKNATEANKASQKAGAAGAASTENATMNAIKPTLIARKAIRAAGLNYNYTYTDKRSTGERRIKCFGGIHLSPAEESAVVAFVETSLKQAGVAFRKLGFVNCVNVTYGGCYTAFCVTL